MSGSGRFDPDNARLRESLAWHARVTNEMQTRVLEASKYVRSHSGDIKLLAILDGDHRSKKLFEGIDASAFTHVDPLEEKLW